MLLVNIPANKTNTKANMNTLLDKTVIFSFDRSGFERHSKSFEDLPVAKPLGRVLITGGTSGIGKACADFLLDHGNQCLVTGRDPRKFESKAGLVSQSLDLSNWEEVVSFAKNIELVDHLVLNAGGMPDEHRENAQGCEYQAASQLVGHLLLFETLHRLGKLREGAKIITVSSGGMLLKKLDLETLFQTSRYDKVAQYANVKRAQVIMTDILATRYRQYHFSAMHPGWVATPALEQALPGFFSFFKKRLRTHYQGADTILWLLYSNEISSGKFWFDRSMANAHPLSFTNSTESDRQSLAGQVDQEIEAILVSKSLV